MVRMTLSPRNVLTVDLDAIQANVRRLRAALRPGTRFCAVMKAEAYGHGGLEVAHAATAAGADCLAVATCGEALQLRTAGYTGDLLTLGPIFSGEECEELAALGVDMALVNEELLAFVQREAGGSHLVRLHLKVDTGMNRQGIPIPEVPRLLDALDRLEGILVTGVMTHLACAGEDEACVHRQLAAFGTVVAQVRARWPHALAHAANSAATLQHPEAHLDMVRCGIAVYGMSPLQTEPEEVGLRPALTWSSVVVAVREFRPGEAVGYGHTYTAAEPGRLALVPVGYADGYRRSLGNCGSVLIRGRRLPIAGRVSMDSFSVLLPPDSPVQPGDRVILVGSDGDERITAEEVARLLGTINYEVTCGISTRRARREFTSAEGTVPAAAGWL